MQQCCGRAGLIGERRSGRKLFALLLLVFEQVQHPWKKMIPRSMYGSYPKSVISVREGAATSRSSDRSPQ
jgi:hypothetical protein